MKVPNLDDLDDMDQYYDAYLGELHAKNPATKAYTKEMLAEDFALAYILLFFGGATLMIPVLESGESRSWAVMKFII